MFRGKVEDKESRMAVKDPVCGMTIEQSDARPTSEYHGVTYFFCSTECKEEFDARPDTYG